MDKKLLEKANKINWEISTVSSVLRNVETVLNNYPEYRSSLELRSEKHVGFSLGSRKYNLKDKIKEMIESVRDELLKEKADLEDALKKL